MTSGNIFDIQRFSLHDGPGIRTVVFLKGCPLNCIWCGNPESISPEPLLSYDADQCIACDACMDVCPEAALSAGPKGKAIVDRGRCTGCGDCQPTCDPKALEIVGRTVKADEVVEEVLRDKAYYESSGGGMTLSGGEPLMQPGFAKALLQKAKEHGLHCCVETSGYALWGSIRGLVPLVDQWLYDVKETDRRLHQRFIGKPNETIRSNLKRLHDAGAKILVRCPMIPQHNARRGHLDGLVRLAKELPRVDGIELLPYYDLWRAKLDRFGFKSSLPESVKPPDRETLDGWKDYLRDRGVTVVG